jgi:hypothetical protein
MAQKNTKQTGKQAASNAGRLLGSKKTPPAVKKVAASDLAQTPRKAAPKKK